MNSFRHYKQRRWLILLGVLFIGAQLLTAVHAGVHPAQVDGDSCIVCLYAGQLQSGLLDNGWTEPPAPKPQVLLAEFGQPATRVVVVWRLARSPPAPEQLFQGV